MKKCGLYLRVSTEEQAAVKEGSLKSQRIRLEALVKSKSTSEEIWKVVRIYTEEGYSGKDLNRPQVQMLLEDVRQDKINVVLCTRIDRITRSLLDFYCLFQTFKLHNVDFICLDDYFDTSTPIGRMALKMILVFAELEREQVSERTKKCLRTRAIAGLWNGGQLLGYDIDPDKLGILRVNELEKKLVNLIFNTYLKRGSFRDTCEFLNESGLHTKGYTSRRGIVHQGTKFSYRHLSQILTNKIYTGKIEINKKNMNKEQLSLPPEQRYQIVMGKQEPIIESRLFKAVQKKIAQNRQKKRPTIPVTKHFCLLKGLLYCGVCGFPMKTTWGRGHGGDYFYYICICQKKYVHAIKIEEQIIAKVREYCSGDYDRTSNSKIEITPNSMERSKLNQFVRRLFLSEGVYKGNILRTIIKRIVYTDTHINIELR